jgi:hypothetical protein
MSTDLSGIAHCIFLYLVRETFGRHQEEVTASIRKIAKRISKSPRGTHKGIIQLQHRRIILQKNPASFSMATTWIINPNVAEWVTVEQTATPPHMGDCSVAICSTDCRTNGYTDPFKESSLKKAYKESIAPPKSADPSVLFDIFEAKNQKLPQIKARSAERNAKCRSRINQAVRSGCLDRYLKDFEAAVVKAQLTPFLYGENDRGWRADIDWFIANQTNPYKVLEGKYDGNGHRRSEQQRQRDTVGTAEESMSHETYQFLASMPPEDLSPEQRLLLKNVSPERPKK